MLAIDVDATMVPMDYEVMTDNEPMLETKKKKKQNKINMGPGLLGRGYPHLERIDSSVIRTEIDLVCSMKI